MRHGRSLGRPFSLALAVALALAGAGCVTSGSYTAKHEPEPVAVLPPPGTVPTELNKVTLPAYVIEPPDVLLVEVYMPPQDPAKGPVALYPQPIAGQHIVKMDGTIHLGVYGSLPVAGITTDQAAEA